MTQTIQTSSATMLSETGKTLTEDKDKAEDNMRLMLSVLDSMTNICNELGRLDHFQNNFCERLVRLDCAVKKINTELSSFWKS